MQENLNAKVVCILSRSIDIMFEHVGLRHKGMYLTNTNNVY